jgi:altronate hydrolase
MTQPLTLHPSDSVAVTTQSKNKIPKGHKIALKPHKKGEAIYKYGQIIGFASQDISESEWVHTHNCAFSSFERDYAHAEGKKDEAVLPLDQRARFMGYKRTTGRAGTRNYIAVLTSVNCSASVARFIAEAVNKSGILAQYPNVDGIIPLVHGTGCGMQENGEGYDALNRTIWGYATNPNVSAVLLVGLGCEMFQIPRYIKEHGITLGATFRTMTIQESGGTAKSIEKGFAAIVEMLPLVNSFTRESLPVSELCLALQCGGSDGYSGITANPALGKAVDMLVKHGGTAILSETPEIYGAEHLLTRRARTREVGEKLVSIIHWWEKYTALHGMSMDNNPSPGNKAGGLTTILEKSLGAAAKGGSTTLEAVYHYAEKVTASGFVYMDTPGYDPVAATGQVAGGANMLAFTTGRGSAYGCKPTPSFKLATNSEIYTRMIDDMDINCGDIIDGVSLEAKGIEIFNRLIDYASGEKTKSEILGYGDLEFVPWQLGATM